MEILSHLWQITIFQLQSKACTMHQTQPCVHESNRRIGRLVYTFYIFRTLNSCDGALLCETNTTGDRRSMENHNRPHNIHTFIYNYNAANATRQYCTAELHSKHRPVGVQNYCY